MLITFEGIDGSGKSTQINMLSEYLKKSDIEHIVTREPGGTKEAEAIRDILKHGNLDPKSEVLLLYASRLEHIKKVIKPNSDKIIISDRFDDSTIAYQHYGRRVSLKDIEKIKKASIESFEPDITVLIDIDPEVREERIKSRDLDRIERSSSKFHKRVIEGYRKMSKDNSRFFVVNGNQSIDEIHKKIVKELIKREII